MSHPAVELPNVEQLLDIFVEDDSVVEAQWQQQPSHELDATIHDYRSRIKQLDSQLPDQAGTPWQEQSGPITQQDAAQENEAVIGDLYGSVDDLDPTEWQVPPHCIPIHANVTTYEWKGLYNHTQFDVIMMDPPWQLATANPTRGVALGYSQLTDNDITALPVNKLQSDGFLFVWVINAKYKYTLDLFDKWGYRWAAPWAGWEAATKHTYEGGCWGNPGQVVWLQLASGPQAACSGIFEQCVCCVTPGTGLGLSTSLHRNSSLPALVHLGASGTPHQLLPCLTEEGVALHTSICSGTSTRDSKRSR